ncbi:MAG: CDP-diacylglycerol--glycerol-3-phosphate 3-phosphatidyltransferase [Gammaproteobacteria bacterium]|nr:CDP-diacylglycerol--glycerol-3-phosphate 3-phosphatidyltransferase [Gammaproteobacteria bacterium]
MKLTAPTILTLLRIALIPVLMLVWYLPVPWRNELAVAVFILAGVTDWLDGWLARKTGQVSRFGAFLDPVADKLMVSIALIMIIARHPEWLLVLAAAVIIGREITVSALREWMAELGSRGLVAVGWLGKLKTTLQMVAIGFLLYADPLFGLPVFAIGQLLLVLAAGLTLWSMIQYLRAAWPEIRK